MSDNKAGEQEFQQAVADQRSDVKPLFRETAKEQAATEPLLRFFRFEHLPESLQEISRPYSILASLLLDTVPRSAERTVALRKLLESKDCAVRAMLPTD